MSPDELSWRTLPRAAQLYVAAVIACGVVVLAAFFPRAWPHPVLFAVLLIASCVTSSWKVNLPISLSSGSTLSVSYAADLCSLLLLGRGPAILTAIAGALTQCTLKVRRPYPWYRTVFSMAAEAIAVAVTGAAYVWFGGRLDALDLKGLPRPLVFAIATCFLVNTGLVACAIGLTLRTSIVKVWRDDFLWSGPSFIVAGAAGALAAVVLHSGGQWTAVLMLAPVYLTYRTYQVFLGRIEDQRRHVEETQKLHLDALEALAQARRAEQALADETERLTVTLRSIGDGVITTDLDGTIRTINAVAETLTGWTQEEAAGLPLSTVFQTCNPETRQRFDNAVGALLDRSGTLGWGGCSMLIARDLTERPIEQSAAPLRGAGGRTMGMVLAFRDVTDAIKVQEERVKAGRLGSLGLLAGGIAHDFNNILMAIMGNVSMARATMASAGPAANALGEAEQACVRARQLTWQLLTFSKGGVPAKKRIALPAVIHESAALVLRGSTVSCAIDVADDLWSVLADDTQLTQVFSNVLINAQQAMPHGGTITIRAQNIVEDEKHWEYALLAEPGPYVRISVADTGIGIPKEHLSRIFDPYFSTKQRGSGLGLATAHSIVKNHGGFVTVDSELGRGTTVHVSLPAALGREALEPVAPIVRSASGPRRVLVMDDEASVRTLAINMLQFLGYEAEVVDSGSAAIERFAGALKTGRPFDVVMLDLIVPGEMGGREAIGQLVDIDPSVRAILVSGYAQDRTMTDYREHGFQAAISKPFTLQELSATLRLVTESAAWRVH